MTTNAHQVNSAWRQLLTLVLSLVTISLFLPSVVNAHHSQAGFHNELQDIEGEITSIIWRNPHPFMTLQVSGPDGQVQTWRIQVLANVNGMNRNGVTGKEFQVGGHVRLTGKLSRRSDDVLLATLASFKDGSVVKLAPDGSSFGSVTYAGNRTESADPEEAQDTTPSLFHVWTVLDRTRNTDLPMRDVARATKEAWDPVLDDYQRNCSPLGMPGAMMSPHPVEFVEQGDDILLKLEEGDGLRPIRMGTHLEGAETVALRMGMSAGRWDESTLVVTTTDIDFPWVDEYGTPQSESTEIVERFTLSEDGRYLDWSATVTDPVNFTEPFVVSTTRWEWLPGAALQAYECAATDDLLDQLTRDSSP